MSKTFAHLENENFGLFIFHFQVLPRNLARLFQHMDMLQSKPINCIMF